MHRPVETDNELAAREVDGHRALAPAACYGRGGCRDRARARRERLPGSTLPDADAQVVTTLDGDELHVGAVREARMALEERPEAQEVASVGLAADDGVRV